MGIYIHTPKLVGVNFVEETILYGKKFSGGENLVGGNKEGRINWSEKKKLCGEKFCGGGNFRGKIFRAKKKICEIFLRGGNFVREKNCMGGRFCGGEFCG